jgi:hypothetical protein
MNGFVVDGQNVDATQPGGVSVKSQDGNMTVCSKGQCSSTFNPEANRPKPQALDLRVAAAGPATPAATAAAAMYGGANKTPSSHVVTGQSAQAPSYPGQKR